MPNSGTVDDRIVELKINHEKFEAGAKKTLSILENLDKGLNSLGKTHTDGFDNVAGALDKVTNKISVMGTIGDQVIRTLTNKALELANQFVSLSNSLTLDQINAGWDKYAEKTQGVQTIMAATAQDWYNQGAQMEWVNAQLEKLNWFTDETSYSFLDMVNNIGKFTSNGVQLETAVTAMEGISTWAALSGANVQEASRAMYNLSQALATGSVKLIDWKSIESANMATREFKETALETAAELGTLIKVGNGMWRTLEGHDFTTEQFNTQLSDAWFTSDVLLKTLDQYGAFTDALNEETATLDMTATELLTVLEEYMTGEKSLEDIAADTKISVDLLGPSLERLAADEFDLGRRAFKAAQEAKTFQEAIDATKDAVSTGWMNIFETIFGSYLDAKVLWTDLAETLYNVFAEPVNKLQDLVNVGFGHGIGGNIYNGITDPAGALASMLNEAGYSLDEFVKAYSNIEPRQFIELLDTYGSIDNALKAGAIDAETFVKILKELDSTNTNRDPNKKEAIALAFMIDNAEMLIKRFTGVSNLLDEITGGDLFREGLMNLMELVNGVAEAFQNALDIIFGDPDKGLTWPEVYGERIKEAMGRFKEFTETLILDEKGIDALSEKFAAVINTIRRIGNIIGTVFDIIHFFVSSIVSAVKQSGILGSLGRALLYLFEGLIAPFKILVDLLSAIIKVRETVNSFSIINTDTMSWIERLAYWLYIIGQYIENAAKAFSDFMQSQVVIDLIAAGINLISDGFKTLVSWISKAIVPITSFINKFSELVKTGYERGGIVGIFENLRIAVVSFLDKHPGLQRALNAIRTVFNIISGVIFITAYAIVFLISKLRDLALFIGNAFSKGGLSEVFNSIFEKLETVFKDNPMILDALTKIRKVISDIVAKIRTYTSRLSSFISELKDVYKDNGIGGVFDLITQKINEFYESHPTLAKIVSFIQSAFNTIKSLAVSAYTTVTGFFSSFDFEGFLSNLPSFEDIITFFSNTFNSVVTWFRGLKGTFNKGGLAGIIGSIGELIGKIIEDGRTFLQPIKDAFSNLFNDFDFNSFLESFGGIVGLLKNLGIVYLIFRIGTLLRNIGWMFDEISGLIAVPRLDAIAKIIKNLTLAMAVLFGGIYLIATQVKPEDMTTVYQLILVLGFVTLALSKFTGNSRGLLAAAAAMVMMATAINMLLIPLVLLSNFEGLVGPGIEKAALVLGAIGMALVLFVAMLSLLKPGPVLAGAVAMLIVASAISIAVTAIIAITAAIIGFASTIDWDKMNSKLDGFINNLSYFGKLAFVIAGFAVALFLVGAAVALFGLGILRAGAGILIFAAGLFVLAKAFEAISVGFPKFVESLSGLGETLKNHWVGLLVGAGVIVSIAIAISKLSKAVTGVGKGGNFGRNLAFFIGGLASSAGTLVSSLGKAILDALPSLLPILGTILVLSAAHFVEIIPDLTEICVGAIITLFSSLATSMEEHKEELVSSVTSLIKTIVTVISGVIQGIFNEDFWGNLDFVSKVLIGLGSTGMLVGLVKNLISPLKLTSNTVGKLKTGFADAKAGIELLIEAAGGLGAVLGPLAGLVAIFTYANWAVNEEQKTLKENAFEGLAQDVEGYNTAIEKTETRIQELQDLADAGYTEAIIYDEMQSLNLLLTTLNSERDALLEQKKEFAALQTEIDGYNSAISETEEIIASLQEDLDMGSTKEGLSDDLAKAQEDLAKLIEARDALLGQTKSINEQMAETTNPDLADEKDNVMSEIDGIYSDIMSEINAGTDDVMKLFGEDGLGGNAMQSLSLGISSGEDYISDALFGALNNSALSAGTDSTILSNSNTAGYNVTAGIADGIYDGAPLVTDATSYIANLIRDRFKSFLGMHSPSKLMASLAAFIPAGVSKGIEDNAGMAEDSMTILGSAVIAAMQEAMLKVATVADEDFDFSPRITPVVDMSNVSSAANGARGMFGNIGALMRGSISIGAERAQTTAGAMERTSNNNTVISELEMLSDRLGNLGDAVANMQIVLDTGVLVGATSHKMDSAFGTIQARKGRGN